MKTIIKQLQEKIAACKKEAKWHDKDCNNPMVAQCEAIIGTYEEYIELLKNEWIKVIPETLPELNKEVLTDIGGKIVIQYRYNEKSWSFYPPEYWRELPDKA